MPASVWSGSSARRRSTGATTETAGIITSVKNASIFGSSAARQHIAVTSLATTTETPALALEQWGHWSAGLQAVSGDQARPAAIR